MYQNKNELFTHFSKPFDQKVAFSGRNFEKVHASRREGEGGRGGAGARGARGGGGFKCAEGRTRRKVNERHQK